MRILLFTPLLLIAGCGDGPDAPPSQAAVTAAVSDALARREVAVRLIDQQIALATEWRLGALERVEVLGEPQADGASAWKVRVAIRGSWSGAMPVSSSGDPASKPPARPTIQGQLQAPNQPPPWLAAPQNSGGAATGSMSSRPIPAEWKAAQGKPTAPPPAALSPSRPNPTPVEHRKVTVAFDRTAEVRLVVDGPGTVHLP